MISEPRGLQMFNLKSPPRAIVQCTQTELCSLCVASAFKITFEPNVKGYYKERVIKLILLILCAQKIKIQNSWRLLSGRWFWEARHKLFCLRLVISSRRPSLNSLVKSSRLVLIALLDKKSSVGLCIFIFRKTRYTIGNYHNRNVEH